MIHSLASQVMSILYIESYYYKQTMIQNCNTILSWYLNSVTNFIQLVSSQPVDRFSQTKLHWKAPNEDYPYICGMYKSNNK